MNDCGTVVEQAVNHHRQTDNRDDIEFAGEVEQHHHTLFSTVEQSLFLKQILTGVACDTKFRQHHHLDAPTLGLRNQTLYLLHVVLHVSHLYCWYCGGHLYKSVFHTFIF